MNMNTHPTTWARSLNNAKEKAKFWEIHGAPINDPTEAAEKNAAMKWSKIIKNGERWKIRSAQNKVEIAQKNMALKAYNKAIKLWDSQPNQANAPKSKGFLSIFGFGGANHTHKRKQKRNRTKRTKRN
jgi:hypothetical protein